MPRSLSGTRIQNASAEDKRLSLATVASPSVPAFGILPMFSSGEEWR